MKSVTIVFLTLLFFAACRNDAQQGNAAVSEDAGAPPVTGQDISESPENFPDTLAPDELLADSAIVEVEAPEPQRPQYKPQMKPAAPSSTAPPAGLRGSTTPTQQGFVDLQELDPSIRLEIRYATTDNFTESKIYDCPRCFLRPEAAQAVVKAHRMLQRQGLGLKMFDCYRPQPYQQRLWDKVPDADYVTPPEKGSMHSRGAAVDLTIVDAQGRELDMGTAYDFFGPQAHTTYYQLPAQVLKNRQLLRRVMEDVGLRGIRTEWWHFSYQRKSFPLSDWVWECRD
ncbi:MAG: D-alanyl-D-alanine dipeptidase [Saprospiraceae bacterium]|jgi:D-alanyl-D-alanine dipeptidase